MENKKITDENKDTALCAIRKALYLLCDEGYSDAVVANRKISELMALPGGEQYLEEIAISLKAAIEIKERLYTTWRLLLTVNQLSEFIAIQKAAQASQPKKITRSFGELPRDLWSKDES